DSYVFPLNPVSSINAPIASLTLSILEIYDLHIFSTDDVCSFTSDNSIRILISIFLHGTNLESFFWLCFYFQLYEMLDITYFVTFIHMFYFLLLSVIFLFVLDDISLYFMNVFHHLLNASTFSYNEHSLLPHHE